MEDGIDALHDRHAGESNPGPAELKELLERPGVLSLASALPASELFPMNAVAQASSLLGGDLNPGEYGIPFQPLKQQIARVLTMRGVRCRPEQIVLTTGSQAALELVAHLLEEPGRPVLLEEIVSEGVRETVQRQVPRVLAVSTDAETGIDLDHVESFLEGGARPAFLYVIPEGHNPLGVSLSLEKRLRLIDLARTHGVPIVEDDAYGFLSYDGPPEPPLRALDESLVLYLGSFSTVLSPALRAGWLILPEGIAPRLPDAAELDVPSFSHRTISAWLEAGFFPEHLETIRAAYRRRRDTLLRGLQEHFPKEVRWSRPTSGLNLWVELPGGHDSVALLKTAVETEGVAFTPGSVFATRDSTRAQRSLRLSFGNNPPHRIEEGVVRLARVVRALLG